jgi:hypothetical protein
MYNYLCFSFLLRVEEKTVMTSKYSFPLLQTQIIAAAAAGVAAEGLSPTDAKAEADNAAQLSVALVENAIVILMLVEDHLRLQSKQSSSRTTDKSPSPLSTLHPISDHSTSLSTIDESTEEITDNRSSLSSGSGGIPLDVCLL